VGTGCVRTDASARPRRASEGYGGEGEGEGQGGADARLCPLGCMVASTRTRRCPRGRACVRADTSVLPPGNFITDSTVRLSRGQPIGHRLSVHPFAIVRVTTLPIFGRRLAVGARPWPGDQAPTASHWKCNDQRSLPTSRRPTVARRPWVDAYACGVVPIFLEFFFSSYPPLFVLVVNSYWLAPAHARPAQTSP
jgi:hypothetical protein